FIEGTSLARLVTDEGPLAVARACEYVRQAALGLQHACDLGMVHRDLKPHNLMLTPRGQVKILDFGLAPFVSGSRPTADLPRRGQAATVPENPGTLTSCPTPDPQGGALSVETPPGEVTAELEQAPADAEVSREGE